MEQGGRAFPKYKRNGGKLLLPYIFYKLKEERDNYFTVLAMEIMAT